MKWACCDCFLDDTPSTFETPDLRSKNTPKETQTAEVPEGETPCHDEEQSDLPEPNTESDKGI